MRLEACQLSFYAKLFSTNVNKSCIVLVESSLAITTGQFLNEGLLFIIYVQRCIYIFFVYTQIVYLRYKLPNRVLLFASGSNPVDDFVVEFS